MRRLLLMTLPMSSRTMHKIALVRFLLGLGLFALLIADTSAAPQAWAATHPSPATSYLSHAALGSQATCHALEITLHGKVAPTQRCADGHKGEPKMLPAGVGNGPLGHPCLLRRRGVSTTTTSCSIGMVPLGTRILFLLARSYASTALACSISIRPFRMGSIGTIKPALGGSDAEMLISIRI